jgi:hypothetical protein
MTRRHHGDDRARADRQAFGSSPVISRKVRARDEEAFAVVEGLVVDADDEAHDAVHDEHDAHRHDDEDHRRSLLRR